MFLRTSTLFRQLPLTIQVVLTLWTLVFMWGVALALYVHHVFVCFPLLTLLVALLFLVPGILRPREGFTTFLMSGGSGRSVPCSGEGDSSKSDVIVRYTAIRDDESGFVDIDLHDEDTDIEV